MLPPIRLAHRSQQITATSSRRWLFAGTSGLAIGLMLIAADSLQARSLNGGAGAPVSAPNVAADTATQAAQRAAAAARQTQDSLARAARAMQDMQAVQAAARAAAAVRQTSLSAPLAVPNGIGAGGLLPDVPAGWAGANAPVQSVDAAGQTQVDIRQTTQQAILNWQSFNVGARTTLTFDQQGNGGWVSMNRVNSATGPSQILGNIKADGQVYVINQSGIIFGGNSQVNVGSLIAAAAKISDEQFLARGIYSTKINDEWAASFTDARGAVRIEAGAQINTRAPVSVTSGGGYVMLLGQSVHNEGTISTPKGQALLAAGDHFILRPGFSTDGNLTSTVRGSEIAPLMDAASTSGRVDNKGLILAQQGDITLAGRDLQQNGALIATTSVNVRGTIHLLNSASDSSGSITLGSGNITAVLPELDSSETALDSQRQALIDASNTANPLRAANVTGVFDNLSLLADRQDQSRIEIVTGGSVIFKKESITAAQGGQVAVSAGARIFAEDGARIDVSGVRNVALAMASNNIKVNVQGNELRDSPQNRDADVLKSNDVWIDARSLILVPAGTGGYASDRYYTGGGLLEVGGYLGTTAHKIGEWAAIGGTITLSAPEVVAQQGAVFDISGGSLDYAAGWIRSTNLIGGDGRRYSVDKAPAYLDFVNFAGGFVRQHNIQGQLDNRLTEVWTSIFDRGRTSLRWEDGYTVGRDAGRLMLSAPTVMIDADIVADVINGKGQVAKRTSDTVDGYKATQTTVAQNGGLFLGSFDARGRVDIYDTDIRISDVAPASGMIAADGVTLPADRVGTAWFDAAWLSKQNLGRVSLATKGAVVIDRAVTLADGGALDLVAATVDIKANVTTHAGSVTTTNMFQSSLAGASQQLSLNGESRVTIHGTATIDTTGLLDDVAVDGTGSHRLAYLDGGSVSLNSIRDVVVEKGALIDVSSGAVVIADGKLKGGKGGSVSLLSGQSAGNNQAEGQLKLGGAIRGYGLAGSGTLAVAANSVLIAAPGSTTTQKQLLLTSDFFRLGFSKYDVTGNRGLTVADGTQLDIVAPVYQVADRGAIRAADRLAAFNVVLPQLHLENPSKQTLTQRAGASLTLQAGSGFSTAGNMATVGLAIGRNATISVDAGQAIALQSIGQLTVDGTLNAWGGSITLRQEAVSGTDNVADIDGRSIWLGQTAVLDVAARAVTAIDLRGRRYGEVRDGGKIVIGGEIDHATGTPAGGLFVVIREGAVLDASGAQAQLDISGIGETLVASNGGSIAIGSGRGLYLDGVMRAHAGGAGAAGGTLSISLSTSIGSRSASSDRANQMRELIISQVKSGDSLAGLDTPRDAEDLLVYGYGRLGVNQIDTGGFGNLDLAVGGQISFDGDVSLHTGQSMRIYAASMALAEASSSNARIALESSYVRLAGVPDADADVPGAIPLMVRGQSIRTSDASLSLKGDLLDVRDAVSFGAHGKLVQITGDIDYDRRGFTDVHLESRGDLRLLAQSRPNPTTLTTPNLLRLTAAQIYPATNAKVRINAGRLVTARNTASDPAQPYSVFGSIIIEADIIDHGGVLRAPLGELNIGTASNPSTSQVNLLPGSVTSVSAAGLVMPYGGTVDGVTYTYNKVSLGENLLGKVPMIGSVLLNGQAISVANGAVIDLSGGGELTGAGFVSGRGGSVDILMHPLVASNPGYRFSASGNSVYAIVPGNAAAYAPVAVEAGAGNPMMGRQITLDGSIPGLPVGTYTLMPSTYALLPGAFRVELANTMASPSVTSSVALPNGSWMTGAQLGIANTSIREGLGRQAIITPGKIVRSHSLYNETDFATFAIADAARLGVPRTRLPFDARNLSLQFALNNTSRPSFSFGGQLLNAPAEGGWGGDVIITASAGAGSIEILSVGQTPSRQFDNPLLGGASLYDADLNALNAGRLIIGGRLQTIYGQGGNFVTTATSAAMNVVVRSGARLSAEEVVLISGRIDGGILVEQGASINTVGKGMRGPDSRDGFVYAPGQKSMLIVSNGYVTTLAPEAENPGNEFGPGTIDVGGCAIVCSGTTSLYSEGTIVVATDKEFSLTDSVRYGTRNLTLAMGGVNVGTEAALAAAAANDILPAGLTMSQSVLDRLLRGDTTTGAPALETLSLTARDAFSFFGTVTLDTIDPVTGKSRLSDLVLTSPALYGHGSSGDVATIRTGNLIWNGATAAPASVVAGGAGTGSGTLSIEAERIEFGYGPKTQIDRSAVNNKLTLGFANVNLIASDRVTANNQSGLSVYQSQSAYVPGTGFTYTGGNLNISTPLLTGRAGSVNTIVAGGAVRVSGATGGAVAVYDLGGEIKISGNSLLIDGTIVLPSGKLSLMAKTDLILTGASVIDVAGREITFDDVKKYSWGGDVILDSIDGNIVQASGSLIDVSARNNRAGNVSATALGVGHGSVDLAGTIRGSTSGYYDAGGTIVPYRDGTINVRAQTLGAGGTLSQQFAALNERLNASGVFGGRSFQFKQGDLTIGNELRAGNISVSVDAGQLTVVGTVDASGAQVGAIRLAANNGLTLTGTAVLDAHGEILRVDSYGKIIDSPNRAIVELSSGQGLLTLASGARIDLRHGTSAEIGTAPGQNDGIALGTLELNAPRLGIISGDIAIDASGSLDIRGARSIAVNAMQTYSNIPYALVKDANGNLVLDTNGNPIRDLAASGRPYQVIDQAWLDDRHAESEDFISAALGNQGLMNGKLAGLNNATYRNAFHLRPGVEVVADGDLVISGDLDLSGHRYDSVNPNFVRTGIVGSGEVGRLNIRAGGDIDLFGSISDGFITPSDMPDDKGWLLVSGKQPSNGDVVVPRTGIELHDGTAFPAGVTLNYDLPIQGMTMAGGTRLPVAAALADTTIVPANTVLAAAIRNGDGTIAYAAGTRLSQAVTLTAGMILDPGTLLSGPTMVAPLIWPKGVPLPHKPSNTIQGGNLDVVLLAGVVKLAMGALIPAATDVKLAGGATEINLRGGDGKGRSYALAQMLPEGSQSWSVRLVAGADVAAADSRLTDPRATHGSIRLADTHYGLQAKLVMPTNGSGPPILTQQGVDDFYGDDSYLGRPISEIVIDFGMSVEDFCAMGDYCVASDVPPRYSYSLGNGRPSFSVLRTGTGDLELMSARDLAMHSLYGVYTAGTSTSSLTENTLLGFNQTRGSSYYGVGGKGYDSFVDGGASSLYRAWYPDHGGNLVLSVGGSLTGDVVGGTSSDYISSSVGNWLWRQGSGNAIDTKMPTSWWINFGTYVGAQGGTQTLGFTGFGTLGGGNIDLQVGGDAGMLTRRGDPSEQNATRSQALVLAVGSTGRIIDGTLELTGGGDMSVRIGGGLNPELNARSAWVGQNRPGAHRHDLTGAMTNLRGSMQIGAGVMGGIELISGQYADNQDRKETRAYDPFVSTTGNATGGLTLVPGDATVSLTTRGDLVLGGVGDAGRVSPATPMAYSNGGALDSKGGYSWFTLWTDHTAIDLFSAGGNLAPVAIASEKTFATETPTPRSGLDASPTDGRFVYPSILRAVAASGNIYVGSSAATIKNYGPSGGVPKYSLLLATGSNGQLQFLAGNSIYAGGYSINPSGADPASMATPFHPGFYYYGWNPYDPLSNATNGTAPVTFRPLFAFGGTSSAGFAGADEPARFYARDGDIIGLRTGEIIDFTSYRRAGTTWYEAARPVWIKAGRDIVNSGTRIGESTGTPDQIGGGLDLSSGNLFVHNSETDISIVYAGRDLIHSSFNIAGPGTLDISAGRHIQMDDKASITSIGAILPGDVRTGASIAMMAGIRADNAGFATIRDRYLDPANMLPAGTPLDGSGKVARTYEKELASWLEQRFGFAGTDAEARAFFAGLALEQQRVFLRQVYFAELTAGGREYNDAASPRFGSYLRGRDMIAALFPTQDAAGQLSAYLGDVTMFGGAGIRTRFGGDIQMMTPGGKLVIGVEGLVPTAEAGLVTQGAGDIQLYSRGSALLGLSRIMTTFGGNIIAWSAEGDINAGRGSKTTILYTPPKRSYDRYGKVTLAPQVPSSGAGIATLNPIPEVPPGDIDLIAPLGTIDAGEAGIRVSGNVNLAALQILNAANIQVQGTSSGIPVVQAPSISAALSTSNATAATQQTATPTQSGNAQPSVIIVEVLGYGGGDSERKDEDDRRALNSSRQSFDPNSSVELIGIGQLSARQKERLTAEEQAKLAVQ